MQIKQIDSLQTTFKEKLDKFVNITVEQDKQFNLQIDKDVIWRLTENDNFNECYAQILEKVLQDQLLIQQNENNTAYEKIQYYTDIIVKNMNEISAKCGKQLDNEYIVKCSCGKSPVACFCLDCFDEQLHSGPDHIYFVFRSSGICDCGQQNAYDSKFFCKKHQHKQIDQQQQILQENQQIFNIRKLISVLVFLTRLQMSFAQLLIHNKEYQKDYDFISQLLLKFLKIKHPVIQQIYTMVIISKYNNLTITKIQKEFNITELYSNVFDINEYIEKLKNDEEQKLFDQPVYTLLIIDYLIQDKEMIQYLNYSQVIESQFRLFIRNQYFIFNQYLIQNNIEKDLYINENNQNIFTDKTTKLFFTKRISNKKMSLQDTIFELSNQIQDNLTGDQYMNVIGLSSELMDQYIIQSCFCRLYGKFIGVEKVQKYRVMASIYEGLSQITMIQQNRKQQQISNDAMAFLNNKLECFLNVFEQQPRNTYGEYTNQQEMVYFTLLNKKVVNFSIQASTFFMQMKNVYNCCNFLTEKMPQLLYLTYVLLYNCVNIKYRTEIVENDKIYFEYLESLTTSSRIVFIPLLFALFETQCVNKESLSNQTSISKCSTDVSKNNTSDLSYMLFYSIMFLSNDMLLQNYTKLQDYIFTPYNLLIIYASRILQYNELILGQQQAIKQLTFAINTYNSQPLQPRYFYIQILQQTIRVLFTRSCFDSKMLRKLGISVEQLFIYFYTPYAQTITIQRETVQFLQYLSYLHFISIGEFVAKYYFLYGLDKNNQILQNALEEKIIDQDQINKIQVDATVNLLVCFLYNNVYKNPREILYHQMISLFIDKGELYKDQIHEIFNRIQMYDFSVIQSIIDDISVEIQTQQDNGIVYDGYIPSKKVKLNQKGLQMINAYDFDFYNQNLIYFMEQSCTDDQLQQFVYKHFQILGNKSLLGCLLIIQQTQQIIKIIVEEQNCQHINTNDIFIILCYVFILSRSKFEEPVANILVQRIIEQLRQHYDTLVIRYTKTIKILLDCILQNEQKQQQSQQQNQQQEQSNIKSKLQNLKNKFKVNEQKIELDTNIQQDYEEECKKIDLIQEIQQNCQFCQICQLQMDEQKLYYPAYITIDTMTQNMQVRVFGCQHACHQYCLEQTSKVQNIFRCPICKLEYNFMLPIIQDDKNDEIVQKLIKVLQHRENVEITIDACIQLIEGIKYSSINNKNQNIKLSALLLNIIQSFMKQNYQQTEQYQQYLEESTFIKYFEQNTVLYKGNNIYVQLLNYNTIFNTKYIKQKIFEIYPNIQQQIEDGLEQIYTLQQFIEQIVIYQIQQYSNNNQLLIEYKYNQDTIEQPQSITYHLERYQFMKNKLELYKQLNTNTYKNHDQMICLYCNQAIEKTQEMMKCHQQNCNYLEQVFYIPENNVILFYNTQTQKCYIQNSPYTQKDGTTNSQSQYTYNLFLNQKLVDDLYNFIESQQFNCIQEDYLQPAENIFNMFKIKP